MVAIKELGFQKSFSFLFFVVVMVLFHIFVDNLFNLPPVRILFLKVFGASIGKSSSIMQIKLTNLHHKGFSGLKIGKKCFIGDETMLDLYDSIELEDEVTIAQRVLVLTHTNVGYKSHPLQKFFPKTSEKVVIKKGSFIGAGSILLPGIVIGEESFVAAGSVVTKSIPKKVLVAGVPAKFIRKIS